MVEAADGAKALEDGWPAFHESTVHASPLLYDFDADGINDVLLATYDGEILVFKDTVSAAAPSSLCMTSSAAVQRWPADQRERFACHHDTSCPMLLTWPVPSW